ncbi:hypothetical protein [Fontivita pretiosa]|uniref:hypothetical protein n=1 Tax=Fontivita pretiosa TaxID=2989684 RepID=UPI003D164F20
MSGSSHTSQSAGSWRGGAEAVTVSASASLRQLQELPRDELQNLAEDLGLDHTRYRSQQDLAAAIYERRQMIAAMDREALLDVVRWGRRPVPANASKEQLAVEISRIKSMRFEGLSHRGLVALAVMRGVELRGDEDMRALIRKLKKQEGLFSRLNRKRRAWIGSIVSNMLGEDQAQSAEYQYLPPQPGAGQTTPPAHPQTPSLTPVSPARETSIKQEIEESGLFGGLASRVKRHADVYLNQKLDEIEARIDRKLDEIDRRLAEWRDKEIANRIRILKITLWASVIVAIISLLYAYVKVNFFPG